MEAINSDALRSRLHQLNQRPAPSEASCVLYIMSRDIRSQDNHALLAAQAMAEQRQLPLVVGFIAYRRSGRRAREQFTFLYDGLFEVAEALKAVNIPLIIRVANSPWQALRQLVADVRPAQVLFDFSPLRGPQALRRQAAQELELPVIEVDTHNLVPVWRASTKQEYAARTIRPKIHKLLSDYLEAPADLKPQSYQFKRPLKSATKTELRQLIAKQPANGSRPAAEAGPAAAIRALHDFIAHRLEGYAEGRNDPASDQLSGLSPYLHYGNLASLRVVLEVEAAVAKRPQLRADADALIEEMVVRKELSDNFCYYNSAYDRLEGAADWARRSLDKHRNDQREHLYSRQQLEQAKTADEAWNAAQRQLTSTGKMHGYMRMYWAKKVLEWSRSPEEAIDHLLYLNDFYHLDGGDPNGYVGIMWSVAGVHDRPWGERPVFGSIRYMNYAGLKRKFDIAAYQAQWPA